MEISPEHLELLNFVSEIKKEIPDTDIISSICTEAVGKRMALLEKQGKRKINTRKGFKKYFEGVTECISLENRNKLFITYAASRVGISFAFYYLTEIKTPRGMLYFFFTKLKSEDGTGVISRTLIMTGHLLDRFVERIYNKFSTRTDALIEIGKVFLSKKDIVPITHMSAKDTSSIMYNIAKGHCLGNIIFPMPDEVIFLSTFISSEMLTPFQRNRNSQAVFTARLLQGLEDFLGRSFSTDDFYDLLSSDNFAEDLLELCFFHVPENPEYAFNKIAEIVENCIKEMKE